VKKLKHYSIAADQYPNFYEVVQKLKLDAKETV